MKRIGREGQRRDFFVLCLPELGRHATQKERKKKEVAKQKRLVSSLHCHLRGYLFFAFLCGLPSLVSDSAARESLREKQQPNLLDPEKKTGQV
jgi:hypothetical protein